MDTADRTQSTEPLVLSEDGLDVTNHRKVSSQIDRAIEGLISPRIILDLGPATVICKYGRLLIIRLIRLHRQGMIQLRLVRPREAAASRSFDMAVGQFSVCETVEEAKASFDS